MFRLFKSNTQSSGQDALLKAIKEGATLVDVRTSAEFQTGSVKGAVNIPLDQLPLQLRELKGKKHIVVFCRSGNRSSYAKSILEQHGFQNVVNGGSWRNVKTSMQNS